MPKSLREMRIEASELAESARNEEIDFLLAERLGLTPSQFQLKQDMELSDAEVKQARKDMKRLAKGDSPQYILGYAWFLGYRLRVAKGVLIPRFETEELVEWALAHLKDGDTVLDLGTGSGNITVALAKEAESNLWSIAYQAALFPMLASRLQWTAACGMRMENHAALVLSVG